MECQDCRETKELHPKLGVCWDCIHKAFLAGPGRDRWNEANRGKTKLPTKTAEEKNASRRTGPRKARFLTDEEVEALRQLYGITPEKESRANKRKSA